MYIYIDGKKISANDGESILDVANRNEIYIPTLCHHEALDDVGACRVCMVEITHKDWGGWRNLVTACLYPVEEGLVISTSSEAVRRSRGTTLDLLMARCPTSDVIRWMAEENGEISVRYEQIDDGSKCIMCSLCVRACERMGCNAIGTVGRGHDKKIAPPFFENPENCIGCGACAAICPTGHIEVNDTRTTREIWEKKFNFVACEVCGEPVLTEEYRDYAIANRDLAPDYYTTCSACKKKKLASHFDKVGS